eukprot:EG_transcript_27130
MTITGNHHGHAALHTRTPLGPSHYLGWGDKMEPRRFRRIHFHSAVTDSPRGGVWHWVGGGVKPWGKVAKVSGNSSRKLSLVMMLSQTRPSIQVSKRPCAWYCR